MLDILFDFRKFVLATYVYKKTVQYYKCLFSYNSYILCTHLVNVQLVPRHVANNAYPSVLVPRHVLKSFPLNRKIISCKK